MKHSQHKDYTFETLHREREYGLYWYSWLWHLLRPLLIAACSLMIVFGVVSFAWGRLSGELVDPVDLQDKTQVRFIVKAGESLTRVASNLQTQNLIRNRSVFKYYADFMGFGQKIQSGEYQLSRDMSINQIAQRLTMGDGKPIVRTITLIPGWTIEDIANYLLKEGAIDDITAFLSKCRAGTDYAAYYYVQDVLQQGRPNERKYVLEGYLAANTYELFMTATQDDIIRKLLSQTEALFKESYHARAEELGLSMDQALALASLIEKEAKTGDFKRVSAIFHNRLKEKMALGSDVTIKYVLGIKRMVLTRQDLAVNSPYNTYLNKGLPPGPICAPSPAALEAALYPDEDFIRQGYLYFCSKNPDTGELHFSRTLQEHEQAVQIYQPLWEAFDQKTGAD
ncbi:MAG: endolytic transglycosylase MltG [Christensenellales bacterium]